MSADDINTLTGRDLDAAVHRGLGKVATQDKYGHWWSDETGLLGRNLVPAYSGWPGLPLVLERLIADGWAYHLEHEPHHMPDAFAFLYRGADGKRFRASGDTLPIAVARAFLLTRE